MSRDREAGFGIVMIIIMLAAIGTGGYFGAGPAMDKYNEIMGKTRDSRRMHEMRNMSTVIMADMSLKGKAPTKESIQSFLQEASPKNWADPNATVVNCLDSTYVEGGDYKRRTCRYQYAQCDGGKGFVVRGRFEDGENVPNYMKDDLAQTGSRDHYDVGSCKSYPKSDENFIDIK